LPQQQDLLPMVLVYSESGMCISPCGKYLAVCLPPSAPAQAHAMATATATAHGTSKFLAAGHPGGKGGGHPEQQHASNQFGLIAIVSLEGASLGRTLCTSPIPQSAKITCIRFSCTCRYVLVGYGGRDTALRPNSQERLRRGLELYRFSETVAGPPRASHTLELARDMTVTNDVLNAAEWQPTMGGSVLYGTDTGRTVSLVFTREVEREEKDSECLSPHVTDASKMWRRGEQAPHPQGQDEGAGPQGQDTEQGQDAQQHGGLAQQAGASEERAVEAFAELAGSARRGSGTPPRQLAAGGMLQRLSNHRGQDVEMEEE